MAGSDPVPGDVWSLTDPDEGTAERPIVAPSGPPPMPVAQAAPPQDVTTELPLVAPPVPAPPPPQVPFTAPPPVQQAAPAPAPAPATPPVHQAAPQDMPVAVAPSALQWAAPPAPAGATPPVHQATPQDMPVAVAPSALQWAAPPAPVGATPPAHQAAPQDMPVAVTPSVPQGVPQVVGLGAPPVQGPPEAFTGDAAPRGGRRTGLVLAAAGLTLLVAVGTVVAVKVSRSGGDGGGAPVAAAQEGDPSRAGSEAVTASGTPDGERVPLAPSASVPPAQLKPGFRLNAGQGLRSPNGKFTLMQQPDGNLVLADEAKRVQWSSQTPSNPGAYASFNRDGDLVVYGKSGGVLWHTATGGKGALLEVRDDGNAVVSQAGKQELWSSQGERGRLYPGQALISGQQRRSPDGRFTLTQQPDGNLVVAGADKKVIWSAQTGGRSGGSTQLQNDGNLVVYGADKQPLWSSGTYGATAVTATLNADGNLALTSGGKVLWATTTDGISKLTTGQRLLAGQSRSAAKGGYELLQQPDGNLVLRNSAKTVVWRSGTSGHPGASTRMQPDGNLVVYDTAGKALWSTKTYGKAATYLLVQDDGSAVLYTAAKKAVWTSKTA
ncbi:hypothetical protein AB0J72_43975 [Dactylosporangium sp. NPDC049742]|uniref:hypothetical protein n=1 Tax=Dactylosporangium sp. NPDC049742 TaxID=3154737 RepID=UPI00343A51A7